jgi:hypothetical protein
MDDESLQQDDEMGGSFHRVYFDYPRGKVEQIILHEDNDYLNHFIIRKIYSFQNEAVRILQQPLPQIRRLTQSSSRRAYEHIVPIPGVLERAVPVPPFTANVLSKTLGVMILYLRVMDGYGRSISEVNLQDINFNIHNANVFIEHLVQSGYKVKSVHEHFCACLKRGMNIAFPENARMHELLAESILRKINNLKSQCTGVSSVPKPPLMVGLRVSLFQCQSGI